MACAREPRRNIILILLPCRDACPRRRRRIYGQFFLLIFITSTCERGSATKRTFVFLLRSLSLPLFQPYRFSLILISTGSEAATVVSLSMLHVGGHIFLAFPRSLSCRTTQVIFWKRFRDFFEDAHGIDLCESRTDEATGTMLTMIKDKAERF